MCIALSMHELSAQGVDAFHAVHAISCLDTMSIPPSIPSIVYLRATIKAPADSGVGQMADVFAQSVAMRMRSLLNPKGDTLPRGEPTITWRGIEDHIPLSVTVYRDAAPAFRLLSPHTDSVAVTVLLDAVHKTLADGEGPFWPAGTRGDSLTFGLSFALTDLGKTQLSDHERFAIPVFSVLFPPKVPPKAKLESAPVYPPAEWHAGITATVIMDFRVDSTGHVIRESIKEVWPPTQKRPTGKLLVAYDDFLNSVTRWLPNATFEPAHIGGCNVQQLVEEPFTFSLK
jgi:hypothetical protein